jgi:hypothetical protein
MHIGIDLFILVGFFSFAMIIAYIAFIPPEAASRRIIAIRDRLVEGRAKGRHRPVTPGREPAPSAAGMRQASNAVRRTLWRRPDRLLLRDGRTDAPPPRGAHPTCWTSDSRSTPMRTAPGRNSG